MALILSTLYVGSIQSLSVVPPRQDRLKTFDDLAREGYRIQIRGNESLEHSILVNMYKEIDSTFRNRHMESLARTAEMASEDNSRFLEQLASK